MTRIITAALIVAAGAPAAFAGSQTDPHITSWLTANSAQYARVYEIASDKTSDKTYTTWPASDLTNDGGGQTSPAYADIQRVAYSANYVYVYTSGLASYVMGNWLTPNGMVYTSWPTNRAAIQKIPRNPSIPTTKQATHGNGGVWINGVFLWENGDGQSYSTSADLVSMSGQGVWNRLAGVAEAFNFDTANGHQPSSGIYHNHINPVALRYQMGDNITYNASTFKYSELATPTTHSPILGWANDGLPVYGPYGYSSAMDATSGIRRMTSGFQKRDGTNGSINLASTGRITLPVWAATVQGVSTTLPSTEYGPPTTETYSVGGGVTATYSIGTFAEDYDYKPDVSGETYTQGVDFDLNAQNVRYCVTPDYPNGTYAYFVSIDSSGNTAFPDVINQQYYGTAAMGTGTVTSITESVTDYVDGGPAEPIKITATASGSGVNLSWNSADGATYEVDSSPDETTWTTLSSTVTSLGTTTTYAASASAAYFRVTLTAINAYDTGGTYGTPVGTDAIVSFGAVAPAITTQPTGATVTAGASVSFTVAASGTAPLTYQWELGGAAISGAASATYSIASAQAANAGTYSCVVTNAAGSATSGSATLTVNAATVAPSITTQPASATVTAGASASFAVAASGTAPLSYQWELSGSPISGATSATYSIASAQAANAGNYQCVVTNTAGSATSNTAVLTVNPAPVAPSITTQPASVSATAGSAVTFTVVAAGTAPLSYQWKLGGAVISTATAASYMIASAQAANAGSYTCVVTNGVGTVTSAAATLTITTVSVAPTIATQPLPVSVSAGGSATFTVAANGTAPFAYQWQFNGAAISGATSASLTLANVQAANAGNYSCVVTNSTGSVTSNAAALTLAVTSVAPTITTQPASASVTAGGSATFTVAASGSTPLTYQWELDGAAISGATSASLTISNAQAADAGNYQSVVTNSAGSATSSVATLTVTVATGGPSITSQPASASVAAGASVTFSVTASGAAPLAYQWQLNGVAIAGATASSYTVSGAQASNAGSYDCVVTNGSGSATSSIATLTVTSGSAPAATARIINLSTRTTAGGAAGTPIAGFVLGGTGSKQILIRGDGPTLQNFFVTGWLPDPTLQLVNQSTGAVIASNDGWDPSDAAVFSAVGAFSLIPGSADAALVTTLQAGPYTALVGPKGTDSGVVLVEMYDAGSASDTATLINASTRAFVGTGDNVLIPGFVISGTGTMKLLIRAVGPTLANFGVPGALPNPQMTLYSGSTVVASNTVWGGDPEVVAAEAATGAFTLDPSSLDSALVTTLPAGAYTVVVSGVNGTTGTALVEIYVVP